MEFNRKTRAVVMKNEKKGGGKKSAEVQIEPGSMPFPPAER